MVSRLQRIPQSGDWFEYAGKKFTVTRMEGHRVGQVKVETLQSA